MLTSLIARRLGRTVSLPDVCKLLVQGDEENLVFLLSRETEEKYM